MNDWRSWFARWFDDTRLNSRTMNPFAKGRFDSMSYTEIP
jgi:hypothetical protein